MTKFSKLILNTNDNRLARDDNDEVKCADTFSKNNRIPRYHDIDFIPGTFQNSAVDEHGFEIHSVRLI